MQVSGEKRCEVGKKQHKCGAKQAKVERKLMIMGIKVVSIHNQNSKPPARSSRRWVGTKCDHMAGKPVYNSGDKRGKVLIEKHIYHK